MSRGYVFIANQKDVAPAAQRAAEGYLLLPMSPSATKLLGDPALPVEAVADVEIQTVFAKVDAEAESMTDELVALIGSKAPEVFDYAGLDARPALYQGVYQTLAAEIAFARHIARVASAKLQGDARAMVGSGPLAGVVAALMRGSRVPVEYLHGACEPAAGVRGGSWRSVMRDLPLLAKSAPVRPVGSGAEPGRPRVALVATAPTHPALCLDVLRLLAASADVELYGCGFGVSSPEGLPVARTGHLDDYAIRTLGALRRRARHYRACSTRIDPILAGLDGSRWAGAEGLVAARLPVIVDRVGYHSEQCLRFAETNAPQLVMMMDEKSMIGRVMTRACAKAGIATLDMQHGVLISGPGLRGVDYSKLCVFGDAARDVLVEWGVNEERIAVTGSPRLDELAATASRSRRGQSREEVAQELGLDPEKPIVLAATQTVVYTITPRAKHDFIAGLVETAHGGVAQVIVKKHPYETDGIVDRLAAGAPGVAVTTEGHLPDLIGAADVVTTIHSTVALEALIVGRPVVIFRPEVMPELIAYTSDGAAAVARDAAGLPGALAEAIRTGSNASARKRDDFLGRHVLLDGRSARRIAELALDLAGQSATKAR